MDAAWFAFALNLDTIVCLLTTLPAPSKSSVVEVSTSSNILHVNVLRHSMPGLPPNPFLLSSTADRRVNTIDCGTLREIDAAYHQEAPILSIAQVADYGLHGDMAGNVQLTNLRDGSILDRRKDHKKYVVRIAVSEDLAGAWVATAGWDAKIFLYWIPTSRRPPCLLEPIAKAELNSNPEAMVFTQCPETGRKVLLMSRRDSTFLYYYSLPDPARHRDLEGVSELELLGRQNLAPHALSWISFTPADIALCPTDSGQVAVATSSIPHMKVLIVRLIFPEAGKPPSSGATDIPPLTAGPQAVSLLVGSEDTASGTASDAAAASIARAQIARQDREEAAILVSCNTMAPQTQYSTPIVVWRPNGSGVFVGGDDGVIRGVEASSGRIIAKLEGHEPGSKIRCLWAGELDLVRDDSCHAEEWLISGGFDHKLIVWS